MRVIGIVGWKNSGKTTLVVNLVKHLTAQGVRVATIKHAHHAFDIDHEGKDSYRHRHAGAAEVIVASAQRWAHIGELRGEDEPELQDFLAKLGPVDLVIVEGFKRGPHNKIEVVFEAPKGPLLAESDPQVIAVATNMSPAPTDKVPVLSLDDPAAIAAFALAHAAEI